MGDEPAAKRKKVSQCLFWLAPKRRFCAMQRQADRLYCLEHIHHDPQALEARVPCPLDGKHSVWAQDLASHLKKCPARPDVPPKWYLRGCNSAITDDVTDNVTNNVTDDVTNDVTDDVTDNVANDVTDDVTDNVTNADAPQLAPETSKLTEEQLAPYTDLVRDFGTRTPSAELRFGGHPAIVPAGGKEQLRHMTQQAALASLLADAHMLSPNVFYVEFGCGKAELARTVNMCVVHDVASSPTPTVPGAVYGYGLVDRGVNRMKADSKLARFAASAGLNAKVLRSRIDIEHLDLAAFLAEVAPAPAPLRFVAISKHLCGVATDLTLLAIVNAGAAPDRFEGMVVAMCCRHACIWDRLLPGSRRYLARNGFANASAFSVLKRVATWAVCGGVSPERVQLGRWARALVDRSRVHAISALLGPKYVVELFEYTDSDITLENQCMRIRRA